MFTVDVCQDIVNSLLERCAPGRGKASAGRPVFYDQCAGWYPHTKGEEEGRKKGTRELIKKKGQNGGNA